MLQSRQLTLQATYAAQRGDVTRAEALLRSAIDACEDDADARRELAELLWRNDRQMDALAMFDAALQLAEGDHRLYVRRGELLRELSMNAEARRSADRALQSNADYAPGWMLRARVARAFGNSRDAVQYYQRALGIAPKDPVALEELAQLQWDLAMLGGEDAETRLQMALASSQKLLDVVPVDAISADQFAFNAMVCRKLQRYEQSAKMFGLAANRAPENADLMYQLAECNQLAGYHDAAYGAAAAALRLNPNHPMAARMRSTYQLNRPEQLERWAREQTRGYLR